MTRRNRVEHRIRARGGVADRGVNVEQRLNPGTQFGSQRELREDNRLVGQRRVEQCKTATVGRQSPSQIAPTPDPMYGFVLHQVLKHDVGRSTVDPSKLEKAAVEPGPKEL